MAQAIFSGGDVLILAPSLVSDTIPYLIFFVAYR